MTLNGLLSKAISRVKGQSYAVDEAVEPTYLVGEAFRRVGMYVRGRLRFPRRRLIPFVGRGVSIRAAHLLTFGQSVTFAPGSFVDAMSSGGVRLGNNVTVGKNTRIEASGSLRTLGIGLTVGDNVGLGTDSFYGCAGGIQIGDDTIMGNMVSFHSENHVIDDQETPIRLQGVTHAGITVGRNCWIGAKATILDGANIGDGSVIAAGSVVTAGVYEPFGIYGGVPAKLIRLRHSVHG